MPKCCSHCFVHTRQDLTPTVETTSEITYKTDITPAPTATAEPVATENIMSEVPENVHIDEQNQTVTIGYDDGGITYEGAKYIGVSYTDQFYQIIPGEPEKLPNIGIVYEDYTLEYPKDRFGDYTFKYEINGVNENFTIFKREVYIHRKIRYYIETAN